jgi:hypothetical protein
VSAGNPLVTFYDIYGRKGEVLFVLPWTPHRTRKDALVDIEYVKMDVSDEMTADRIG